mmetsp:Transcript_93108/g.216375  ORF Transcript_93108/g.216375 Transcript_93108/m.216375 type:complete len:737 (-) Transcript_93108:863-3073(-)|eukprot:CAMPEP_0171110080 /NCGR_PEP_ID=MMETSP0766_2-20121228/71149_1 /TAXON_ID=439317 /ORGANISM="Gambierdiscus australes, Strain CAWD 149" /LENGTH=736 /DNA_ID=CAMNT_0011571911 /DNA_START=83 /DNA_END=2293 /DNA_ORIENTATION=-
MTAGRSNTGLRKRHALQLFKTDMCKFFLQSRCENGDNCSYAHNIDEVRRKPDLTRTSMCKAMVQAGVCTDKSCRFAHSESQLRATHGFFKMKMCGFALSGRCKHGKNCRFAHSPEELRPAKPPPPGTEDDLLLLRQPAHTPTEGSEAPPPGTDGLRDSVRLAPQAQGFSSQHEDFKMNDFIFGVTQQDEHPLPPPPEPHPAVPVINERRLQRRQAVAAPQQSAARPKGCNSRSTMGTAEPDSVTGALSSTWNESDSADGSSWASGSSATEVPRSEHTGSPPPTTSDSSSGAGAVSSTALTGAAGSASANGSGSTSGEQQPLRIKAKERRPPRELDCANTSSSKVTTLLITNIPTYLTQGALLSMFEDLTYTMRGNFDFYYCPWDENIGQNLGYALLNFVDPNDAAAFQQTWSNKELCRGGRGQKPLRVMKAVVQGLQANLEYFSKVEIARCADLRFRPLYRDANGLLQPLQLNAVAATAPQEEASANTDVTLPEPSLLPEPPPTILAAAPPGGRRQGRGQPSQDTRMYGHWHETVSRPPATTAHRLPAHHGRPRRSTRSGDVQSCVKQEAVDGRHQACPQHGGDFQLQLHQNYWSKPQAAGNEMATSASQQVLTWPVMMTAMPWPMSEQTQKSVAPAEKDYQGSLQDLLLLGGTESMANLGPGATPGGGCGAGSSALQAQYQQFVPYMMMPMDMVPVDGGHIDRSLMQHVTPDNMHMLQPMALTTGWPGSDEVYTD